MATIPPQLDSSEDSFLAPRSTLYDCREDFTERISPLGVAAIFFGTSSFGSRDVALGRQALIKLSYAFRHFLSPSGFSVRVDRQTAIYREQNGPSIYRQLARFLAQQVEGIEQVIVQPQAHVAQPDTTLEVERVKLQAALSLDQHGGSTSMHVRAGQLQLEGSVANETERLALSQLTQVVCREPLVNALGLDEALTCHAQPEVDDDSLRAFVLFRLWLSPATTASKVRVSANRGAVLLQGKVSTEAERRAIDLLARTTLGVRRLRNSLVLLTGE